MKLERQGTDYRVEDVPKVSEGATKPWEKDHLNCVENIVRGCVYESHRKRAYPKNSQTNVAEH